MSLRERVFWIGLVLLAIATMAYALIHEGRIS